MKVLVFEDNLLWSVRLRNSLSALGHESTVFTSSPNPVPDADAAIVNLSSRSFELKSLISNLRSRGIYVVAHAGHKDKPLLAIGEEAGSDAVVTNGTLAHKLADVLSLVKIRE